MNFDEWKKFGEMTALKATVEQIEKETLSEDDGRVPHVPFGFRNADWLKMKGQMRPGDELYSYCSSHETWHYRMGRMGYVLVRNGEVLEELTTRMS